ncbi:MAG: F0F1 ATP synthase subunit A [Lachnospiraceae bacterium]|nr:F0F1 ATP synthase subunit A [Lachnospiraceae bacterium]
MSVLNQGIQGTQLLLSGSTDNLGFYIEGYAKFNLFGQTVYITTTHVCMTFVFAILVIFAILANRTIKKADPTKPPTGFLNVIELLVETVDNILVSSMGPKYGPKFANYVGSLFAFLLLSNLSGLIGFRPPTADFGVTLPLALITWVLIQYNGIKYQKWGKLKGLFEPFFVFFPINVISEFATPVSMSLRLFGNLFSGTLMMSLVYGLIKVGSVSLAIAWPAALHAYLDVFSGAIQAYVFIMLTMVFTYNAIGDES